MIDESFRKRSLFKLVADLPRLLIELFKEELDHFKQEMAAKLKHAGIGIGLFAGAAFLGFFLFAVLIAAAILGFAVIVPGWAAALIVAAILLVIVVILVLIGVAQVKKGMPPVPTETITSVKQDVDVIKGVGKRANP